MRRTMPAKFRSALWSAGRARRAARAAARKFAARAHRFRYYAGGAASRRAPRSTGHGGWRSTGSSIPCPHASDRPALGAYAPGFRSKPTVTGHARRTASLTSSRACADFLAGPSTILVSTLGARLGLFGGRRHRPGPTVTRAEITRELPQFVRRGVLLALHTCGVARHSRI